MFTKTAIAASVVMMSITTVQAQGPYRIGITQNNVGVDSYQTTYESAFEAAAESAGNVDIVVLDAGGDVARQIGQMQDLIQQRVDAIIIWPTNGQAVIPAIRQAHNAGIPVVVTNSKIAEAGLEFIAAFSGPDNVQQGISSAEMMCDALGGEGQIVQIAGQPGYTTAMERATGFEDRLAEACPGVELIVVVLSTYSSDSFINRLFAEGVCGFLHKNADVNELEMAIQKAAQGERFVLTAMEPGQFVDAASVVGTDAIQENPLTSRQSEVLKLVARGFRSKAIADQLNVSIKTIETHRADIMRRLGVRHTAGLVHEAIRLGLLVSPQGTDESG